jgi:2'-5' RNA ligase
MSNVLRTFIALDPDPASRAWLQSFLEALQSRHGRLRWVKPEHLHLTVNFLGNVAADRIGEIEKACAAAAGASGPLRLELGRPGSFGPRKVPRTLWIGFLPCAGLTALSQLQKRLEAELSARGFPRDERPWTPHLTLGRNPRSERVDGWEDLLPPWRSDGRPRLEAEALALYSSDLKPDGPIHHLIRSERLSAGGRS